MILSASGLQITLPPHMKKPGSFAGPTLCISIALAMTIRTVVAIVATVIATVILSLSWDDRTHQHDQRNHAEQHITKLHTSS